MEGRPNEERGRFVVGTVPDPSRILTDPAEQEKSMAIFFPSEGCACFS